MKNEGDYYYEGTHKKMFIFHQQYGTRYEGQVNEELQYEGRGSLVFQPLNKDTCYQYAGYFK